MVTNRPEVALLVTVLELRRAMMLPSASVSHIRVSLPREPGVVIRCRRAPTGQGWSGLGDGQDSGPYRKVRRERLRLLRLHWWRLALLFVPVVGLPAAMFAAFLPPGDLRGFLRGLTVAGYGSLIATLFAVTGTTHRRMGGSAEEWTSSELRKLGRSWRVFDRVEFRKLDVDHVAVGPDKVLIVDAKWTSLVLDPRRPDRILASWVADAQDGGRRIRLLTHGAAGRAGRGGVGQQHRALASRVDACRRRHGGRRESDAAVAPTGTRGGRASGRSRRRSDQRLHGAVPAGIESAGGGAANRGSRSPFAWGPHA